MKIFENDNCKLFRSDMINFNFNKKSGHTATWGLTPDKDPVMSPYGPMILDIEITDICKGPGGIPCPFCYKSNTPNNDSNMSLDMFKDIIDRMPRFNDIPLLNQMAIGADAQCESNPDTFAMMKYARKMGIIPNITVADINDETADKLSQLCGACAVSVYSNKEHGYNSVKKLVDRGMKQVNIHKMICQENLDEVYELFNDYLNGDPRLKGLNAIVLLSLKTKGRGDGFTPLSQDKFKELVDFAMDNNIPLGFDSCSCHKFLKSVKNRDNFKQLEMLSEPCESGLFSAYINSKGLAAPCSFMENQGEWVDGIRVDTCNDYLKDIWFHPKMNDFRKKLLDSKRNCFTFKI